MSDANIDFEESDAVDEVAQEFRDSNVLVQTVGITDEMSLMTLVQIATSDIYVWPDVDDEMLNELKKLEKQPCNSDALWIINVTVLIQISFVESFFQPMP